MTDKVNEHLFNFKLPMFPNQAISEHGMQCSLEMDGKQMKGVTGGHLRFGANGFTNVVIEFEASCLAEFAAHLTAHMTGLTHDEQVLQLAEVYRDAKAEIDEDLEREGAELDAEYMAQADFVKRIIELTVERLK